MNSRISWTSFSFGLLLAFFLPFKSIPQQTFSNSQINSPDSVTYQRLRISDPIMDSLSLALAKTLAPPEPTNNLKDASALISLLALFGSVYFFFRSRALTLKTNSLPALTNYMQEWRSEDNGVIKSYEYIKRLTPEQIENAAGHTFHTIPDKEMQYHARRVSYYFDNLGLMVYSGVLEHRFIVSFIGGSAYKSWEILKNYIIAEREKRKLNNNDDPHYQRHFEYFAALHIKGIQKLNFELDKLAIKINAIHAKRAQEIEKEKKLQ